MASADHGLDQSAKLDDPGSGLPLGRQKGHVEGPGKRGVDGLVRREPAIAALVSRTGDLTVAPGLFGGPPGEPPGASARTDAAQAWQVSEKGQVTIPKKLRARLGLTAGTVLVFEERQGTLVASRAVAEDPIRSLVGLGERRGVDVDRWLATSRGPAWSKERDGE